MPNTRVQLTKQLCDRLPVSPTNEIGKRWLRRFWRAGLVFDYGTPGYNYGDLYLEFKEPKLLTFFMLKYA